MARTRESLITHGFGGYAPHVLRGALEGVARLSFEDHEVEQLVESWLTTPQATGAVAGPGYRSVVLPVGEEPQAGDTIVRDDAGEWSAGPSIASDLAQTTRSDWPLTGWKYRKPLTIDRTKVPGPVANHLLAVDFTNDLDFLNKTLADRSDVRFTDAAGALLAHEFEGIDPHVLTSDGAWCWFADARAIERNGRLFVCWIASNADIKIASWDLTTGNLLGSFLLRGALLSGVRVDDHANPAIVFRSDGRLAVFYSAHSGASMWCRISSEPEDVTAWGAEQQIANRAAGTDFTYPNPVYLADEGRHYLFWRSNGSNGLGGCPTYAFSDDDCATWSDAEPLIANTADGGQRPYCKVSSNGRNSIHVFVTDGHPREYTPPGTSIYAFEIRGGRCWRSNGDEIGPLPTGDDPLTYGDVSLVFDSSGSPMAAWVWDVAHDASGRPVGVFAGTDEPLASDHRYFYAYADELGSWTFEEICPAGGTIGGPVDQPEPQYSGGIYLDHVDPRVVFLSRFVAESGTWELERWRRSSSGWEVQQVTQGTVGGVKNVRPITVRDRVLAPEVIWMQGNYATFVDYYSRLVCWPALPTTGPTRARVSVPAIDAVADVKLFVYYGRARAPIRKRAPYGPWRGAWTAGDADPLRDGAYNLANRKPHLYKSLVQGFATRTLEVPGPFGRAHGFGAGVGWLRGGQLNIAGWTAISVWAWAKVRANSDGVPDVMWSNWASNGVLGSPGSSPAISGAMLRRGTTGRLNFVVAIGNATVGGDFADLIPPNDGAWHLYGATWSTGSGQVRAFMDGVASAAPVAAVAAALDPDASGPNVGIGKDVHGADQSVRTSLLDLAEIRVADRETSANEQLAEFRNLRTAGFVTLGGLELV